MPLKIENLLARPPLPYREGWELQKLRVAQRQRGEISDTLILLQHPPTITYGRAADRSNLLLTPEGYAARGIEVIETDRGGDVTYHGPGQLVGYPILHLGEGRRDVHRYVRMLEEVLIRAVGELGVVGAGRASWHAGLWVGDGYLAALGVKVARWVTHHGFALNVTPEVLDDFSTIVPCGVPGKTMATVSALAGRPVSVADAADAVWRAFAEVLAGEESVCSPGIPEKNNGPGA